MTAERRMTMPTPSRRHLSGTTAAALLFVATAAACGGKAEKTPGEEAPAPAVPVAAEDVVRVERKEIRTGPRIAGSLDPRQRADMRAEASGQVLDVKAELGEAVKKGQLLARIDSQALGDQVRSAQAAVRAARENLTATRRQVERTRALVQGGALAERDLETASSNAAAADAQLGQAQAQLASARTQLSNATVKSPMNGVVSEAPVHTGDVVAQGAPLFTIIDPSTMRLEAAVSSEDLSSVSVGTTVVFEVRGYPGQRFEGKVERVAPAADPATRQIPILVSLPNEGGKLVAGLFAEGRLTTRPRVALVVPAGAINTSGETPIATRVVSGVVERVNLQLGIKDESNELYEVISGLQEGDLVLLRNAAELPPGTRVELPGQNQPAPAAGQPAPAPAQPAPAAGQPVPAPAQPAPTKAQPSQASREPPAAAKPSGTAER